MPNKTGFHVQLNNRNPNYDDRMRNLQPAGMTWVCDSSMLWYILDFKKKSPNTRHLLRLVDGEEDRKRAVGVGDPKTEAQKFAKFCDNAIPKKIWVDGVQRNNPLAPLRNVVYFQPYDEIGGPASDPQTEKNLRWISDFTVFAVEEFKALGLKFAAINLSEGCPPDKRFDSYSGWDLLIPALKKINEVGPNVAIVQLHTYGFGHGMFDSADAHLLRFMSLIELLDELRLSNVYIAFGEAGKDNPSFRESFDYYVPRGTDKLPDGMTAYTAYANDWIDFDQLLVQQPRVLWANWYTLDMLEDGYIVADQVRVVGSRVTDVYPLFSIVEKHCQDNPAMYLVLVAGDPTTPPPTPEPTWPRKAHTLNSTINIRSTPEKVADNSNVVTVLAAGAPFVGVKQVNNDYQECQIGPAVVGYITVDPSLIKYDL